MSKIYSSKSNAKRAADKAVALLPNGTTYEIGASDNSGGFSFEIMPPAAPEAVEQLPKAHDPAETMKQPHTDNGAAIVEPQAEAPKAEAPKAEEIEVPFSYLPGTREGIIEVLRNDLATETRSVLYRVLDDAGIPMSEIRGMAREVAEEHVLLAIEGDRANFLADHGKKLSVEQATALRGNVEASKPARTPRAASGTASATVANRRKESEVEGPVKRVWTIASNYFTNVAGGDWTKMKRKEVLAQCDAEGIAFYTGRTQYQRWYTAQKESETNQAAAKAKADAAKN